MFGTTLARTSPPRCMMPSTLALSFPRTRMTGAGQLTSRMTEPWAATWFPKRDEHPQPLTVHEGQFGRVLLAPRAPRDELDELDPRGRHRGGQDAAAEPGAPEPARTGTPAHSASVLVVATDAHSNRAGAVGVKPCSSVESHLA